MDGTTLQDDRLRPLLFSNGATRAARLQLRVRRATALPRAAAPVGYSSDESDAVRREIKCPVTTPVAVSVDYEIGTGERLINQDTID